MQLKDHTDYRARDGSRITIIGKGKGDSDLLFAGRVHGFTGPRRFNYWDADGSWSVGQTDHKYTIVAEWRNGLTIEAGKSYRTKDGKKATNVRFDGPHWVLDIEGWGPNFYYTSSGLFCGREDAPDWGLHLVAEWTEDGPTPITIKPGVYGRVAITEAKAPAGKVALVFTSSGNSYDQHAGNFLNAAELRDAAMHLLAFAAALEEKAEAEEPAF